MKKSNYLVILFAIVILGGNSLFKKPESNVVPMKKHTKKLANISVIVAQSGSKVVLQEQFSGGQFSTFTYFLEEGEQAKIPSFGVRNDTLFVFASSSEKEYRNDSFFCTGIKSIVGMERSIIRLGHFRFDSLHIKLRYAQLSGDMDLSNKKPRMLTLDADSSNIKLENYMYYIDQIRLRLNRSHLEIRLSPADSVLITGSLKNYSRLSIGGKRQKLKISKDETSYCNLESFNFPTGTSTASAQFPKL